MWWWCRSGRCLRSEAILRLQVSERCYDTVIFRSVWQGASDRFVRMNLTSPRTIRFIAALLLFAAFGVTGLAFFTYQRGRNRHQLEYTKTVKRRDIADTARNAMSALQDAELQAEDYALTGETTYSEGYAKDAQEWRDESGTLELVAQHDRSASLVHDLTSNGARVLTELTQIISIYDSGSHDGALDRIRKGSAIVFLEKSRETLSEVQRIDGLGADESDQVFITDALRTQKRLSAAVAGLLLIAVGGIVLLIVGTRRDNDARSAIGTRQSVAKAI